jgi:hypothetical protein
VVIDAIDIVSGLVELLARTLTLRLIAHTLPQAWGKWFILNDSILVLGLGFFLQRYAKFVKDRTRCWGQVEEIVVA